MPPGPRVYAALRPADFKVHDATAMTHSERGSFWRAAEAFEKYAT